MHLGIFIVVLVVTLLALAAGGVIASDLTWPLAPQALAPLGIYLLALTLAGWLCIQLVILTRGLARQQEALSESQQAVREQLESAELAQLVQQFISHTEALLDKESLDPNKRSVMRCLSVDALRGNAGRGDVTYTRLARLFEWLDDEAARHEQEPHRQRLMTPTLMHYAEIAWQLCRVGECQPDHLGQFLRHRPAPPTRNGERDASE
ncbi:hypothetical protein [Salinicola aestuarinus]|uniref:hypothetical protein n=1 Tax=Salinicola aestuarinus TaxID=1949082 RepID=UPI00130041AD|nr:hypothetical protein [Salinicola aestuarinus]